MLVHTHVQGSYRHIIYLVMQCVRNVVFRHLQRVIGVTNTRLVKCTAFAGDMDLQIPQTQSQEGIEKLVSAGLGIVTHSKVPLFDAGANTQILQMLAIANEHLAGFRYFKVQIQETYGLLTCIHKEVDALCHIPFRNAPPGGIFLDA